MKKDITITCPNCGKAFLPGEIYLPNHFLGQPKKIIRDPYDKIIEVEGINMDLNEEYTCDRCNTAFLVSCNLKFFTKVDDRRNPNITYKVPIKTGLNLDED